MNCKYGALVEWYTRKPKYWDKNHPQLLLVHQNSIMTVLWQFPCLHMERPSSNQLSHGLVWFDWFVHPLSHTCNIGLINYSLQFIYYKTMYNIWTSTQYNVINNSTKFKGQLEVKSVTTSRRMCIYINTPNSWGIKIENNNIEWYWVNVTCKII